MNILITASGSHGDVYPFVALGRELQQRGHQVTLFANATFESLVRRAGLAFSPVGTADDYRRVLADPDLTHARKAFGVVMRSLVGVLEEGYTSLADAATRGDALLVGSSLALPSRVLQETHRIPGITIHLAPSVFRSSTDPAHVGPTAIPGWVKPFLMRGLYNAIDRLFIDPAVAPHLNAFRQTFGLPPVRRVFNSWIHSPDLAIGLFPDWFASEKPDWPPQAKLTGFPLYDQPEDGLDADVAAFLDKGSPPVLFTTGTATASVESFFLESAEACRQSGRRGMLLTRFSDQLPQNLPVGVRHFRHAPFSLILPRCAAIVHHGGIGTSSQALRAGIPQLIRPMAFDQFDNFRHLEHLGVARQLSVKKYTADAVANTLDELTDDPAVANACRACRDRLEGDNAVARTCDLIEDTFCN